MRYQLQVKSYPNQKHRIIVPYAIYHQHKSIRKIQNGPYLSTCEWLSHNKDTSIIYISSSLLQQLQLTVEQTYTISLSNYLCSIVYQLGIFIANMGQIDRYSDSFQTLVETGHTFGFDTILFHYKDLDFHHLTVTGYTYTNNTWSKISSPIPPVVYNRLPNRKIEAHPSVQQQKEHLKTYSIIFNPDFFNKWNVFRLCMQSSTSRYLLPHTIFQPSQNTVLEWIERTPCYIKPIHGSKGKGIYYLEKIDHHYAITYTQIGEQVTNKYSTFEELFTNHFDEGLQGYVIQEAIPLLANDQKKIDIRVHTNKDEHNNWHTSIIYIHQEDQVSILTHASYSADVYHLDDYFSAKEAESIQNKLNAIVLSLSNHLDQHYKGQLGELAFDFGIDNEKKLWLFEINAKPGWFVFEGSTLFYKEYKEICQYLYRYAFYLAK
jgi:hypothetical protein